jgi:hypothetical protein
MQRNKALEAKLIEIMSKLELSPTANKPASEKYASNDALTFQNLIPNEYETIVLGLQKDIKRRTETKDRMKKMGYGTTIGLSGKYTRNQIKTTAAEVKDKKFGECHTFAQLAADTILNAMETSTNNVSKNKKDNNKNLEAISLKIVSHQAGRYSHSFILINHQGEDVNTITNEETFKDIIIIDAWACVMGEFKSQGVFTLNTNDNNFYPYPGMLKNLICVYDSNKDPDHQKELGNDVLAKQLKKNEARTNKIIMSKQSEKKSTATPSSIEKEEDPLAAFINSLTASIEKAETLIDAPKFVLLKTINEYKSNEKITSLEALSLAFHVYLSNAANLQMKDKYFLLEDSNINMKLKPDSMLVQNIVNAFKENITAANLLGLDAYQINPVSIISLSKKIAANIQINKFPSASGSILRNQENPYISSLSTSTSSLSSSSSPPSSSSFSLPLTTSSSSTSSELNRTTSLSSSSSGLELELESEPKLRSAAMTVPKSPQTSRIRMFPPKNNLISGKSKDETEIETLFYRAKELIELYKINLSKKENLEDNIKSSLTAYQLTEQEKELWANYINTYKKDALSNSPEDNQKVIRAFCKKLNKTGSIEYEKQIQKILGELQTLLAPYKAIKRTRGDIKILLENDLIQQTSMREYCKLYINTQEADKIDHKGELAKILTEYRENISSGQLKPRV